MGNGTQEEAAGGRDAREVESRAMGISLALNAVILVCVYAGLNVAGMKALTYVGFVGGIGFFFGSIVAMAVGNAHDMNMNVLLLVGTSVNFVIFYALAKARLDNAAKRKATKS